MMYYYANLYVGDFEHLKTQALIIDTGSGIMSFPCKEYCQHCGKHLNEYYPIKGKSLKIKNLKHHEFWTVLKILTAHAITEPCVSLDRRMARAQAIMDFGLRRAFSLGLLLK